MHTPLHTPLRALVRAFALLLTLLLTLAGCEGSVSSGRLATSGGNVDVGRLDLALGATSATAKRYRLMQAEFAIEGPAPSSSSRMLATDDASPDEPALRIELPEGEYSVRLEPGWEMLGYDARTAAWVDVDATLLSPVVPIEIVVGEVSQAVFTFQVPEGTLGFGVGEIVIEVDENGACPADYTHCGAGCVDLSTSISHCGGCGQACGFPHASAACAADGCALDVCEPGFDDCDGDEANGCESELASDPISCGACGASCLPGQSCADGACVGPACSAGTADCDDQPSNGCEVDLNRNQNHCGACGTACGAGTTCVSGACIVPTCAAGRANCDGQAGNGCEVDLNADRYNCGACGTACGRFLFFQLSCRSGVCAL